MYHCADMLFEAEIGVWDLTLLSLSLRKLKMYAQRRGTDKMSLVISRTFDRPNESPLFKSCS
jgi:hypothetical protein